MPPSLGYVPGPLVIPQTAEIRLSWQFPNAKLGSNVLHAIVADGFTWDNTQADDVMNGIVSSLGWGELSALLHTDTRLLGVEIKDLRVGNLAGFLSTSPAADGLSAAKALPTGVALVVSLRTAQAGRSFRGRVYIGGWTDDATEVSGTATTAAGDAALDFVDGVRAAMNAVGFELAIAHRGHDAYISPATGRTVDAELPGSVPVTSTTLLDHVFDSQRRRS